MAALDPGVFSSKQFVFAIGKHHASFTVHAAVIANQSKALHALINGSMKEASEGKAIFEDVDEDTFIRFCQFAYTGDYTTPDFTYILPIKLSDTSPAVAMLSDPSIAHHDESSSMEPEPQPAPAPDPAPVHESGELTSKKSKKPKKLSKSSLLRKSLHNKLYDTDTLRTALLARCEVRENSNNTEDYTTVFLGHVQVYVFAEKWGVESLKTLVLSKLHRTLITFTLFSARRPDIVELLRFTFSDERTPDLTDAVDELRSLVILYTACEVENLIQCPEFLSLIEEGGPIVRSLVQMLMKRIP